jgi:hypothetical protein
MPKAMIATLLSCLVVGEASASPPGKPKTPRRLNLPTVVVRGTRQKPEVVYFIPRSPLVDEILNRPSLEPPDPLR